MKGIDDITVTTELRSSAQALVERLSPVRLVAPQRWRMFAQDLVGVQPDPQNARGNVIVVGSPADVLRHAATDTVEFGFIMPVAHSARWWQRSTAWRDDATLALWGAGWSPLCIDRILVPKSQAVLEFVIGNARQIPAVAVAEPDSNSR